MNALRKWWNYFRPVTKRSYADYAQYLQHQREKTLDPERRRKWLDDEWQIKCDAFRLAFLRHPQLLQPKSRALCLAARTGQEVQVLLDLGLDAIGFDIVPCPPLVVQGDFHQLGLEDACADLVFTNAFDHALFPQKLVAEMERTLKPGGHALLHLQVGKPLSPDGYDVTFVGSSRDAHALFAHSQIVHDRAMPDCLGMNWEVLMRKNG